jgi:hypothetical protein
MYMYFLTKLYSQQAQVVQNHEYGNVRNTGQGAKPNKELQRGLSLAAVRRTALQVTVRFNQGVMFCTRPGLT